MVKPFAWQCPYCNTHTTITNENLSEFSDKLATKSKHSSIEYAIGFISCPNPACKELSCNFGVFSDIYRTNKNELFLRQLLPESNAKPQPDYIPEEIRNNYREACLIRELSPKASAAMSRRCLQGIVRDFWDIPKNKRGKLGAELSYIQEKIEPENFEAIRVIREIGDIGAHMEKDVNLIIDINEQEANLLIELIETLFLDWYVARHKKQERHEALKQLSQAKRAQKKINKSSTD